MDKFETVFQPSIAASTFTSIYSAFSLAPLVILLWCIVTFYLSVNRHPTNRCFTVKLYFINHYFVSYNRRLLQILPVFQSDLLYCDTQEYVFYMTLKIIQYAIGVQNTSKILRKEGELLNNSQAFSALQFRQVVESIVYEISMVERI